MEKFLTVLLVLVIVGALVACESLRVNKIQGTIDAGPPAAAKVPTAAIVPNQDNKTPEAPAVQPAA